MAIKATESIRHSGRQFKSGDLIKGLNAEDEKRLLDLKSAEKVFTDQEIENTVTENPVDPKVFAELSKDLDENFNAEELKREAKNAGVQFETNATKTQVIEAVIKQDKVSLLLEEDGE